MTPLQCFSLTTDNHIAHLVLNKPEAMNTMHPAFWRELDQVLTELHQDGKARALVISSTGKHFSAGMALETFAGASPSPGRPKTDSAPSGGSAVREAISVGATFTMDDQSPEGRAAIFDTLGDMQATFTKLETLRMPVIAAIQGGCIGGAVDMVCACCIRYATAQTFFCIQEINIGMVADVGTLQRLPKLIPLAVVKEMAYTGKRLDAQRALQYGLVNAVFDTDAAMLEAALQCAAEIASKPPIAIWGTKQAIQYARDHSVDDALKQMGWLQGAIWSNRHVMEAVMAMKSKRAGDFPALAKLTRFADVGL
jgi:enoyl-CoA hydratase